MLLLRKHESPGYRSASGGRGSHLYIHPRFTLADSQSGAHQLNLDIVIVDSSTTIAARSRLCFCNNKCPFGHYSHHLQQNFGQKVSLKIKFHCFSQFFVLSIICLRVVIITIHMPHQTYFFFLVFKLIVLIVSCNYCKNYINYSSNELCWIVQTSGYAWEGTVYRLYTAR